MIGYGGTGKGAAIFILCVANAIINNDAQYSPFDQYVKLIPAFHASN